MDTCDVRLLTTPEPSKSKVSVTIKVASIDTKNEKRDGHLKSDEFFDAAKYPDIKFESTKIEKTKNGFVAHGDLTMRGVTKKVELPFEIAGIIQDPWGNTRMGLEASLEVNRKDWNINWSQTMDNGGLVVADNVDAYRRMERVTILGDAPF